MTNKLIALAAVAALASLAGAGELPPADWMYSMAV